MITSRSILALSICVMALLINSACSRDVPQPAEPAAPAPETTEPETAAPETSEPAPEPESAELPELAGTAWKLVKISSMDDTEAVPADDTAYTITFNNDGSAAMQVDCNRATSNYDSPGPGQLMFGTIASTRAMCPPESLYDQFLREIEYVRSYVLENGNLYLATMADGSIIEFEPLKE